MKAKGRVKAKAKAAKKKAAKTRKPIQVKSPIKTKQPIINSAEWGRMTARASAGLTVQGLMSDVEKMTSGYNVGIARIAEQLQNAGILEKKEAEKDGQETGKENGKD